MEMLESPTKLDEGMVMTTAESSRSAEGVKETVEVEVARQFIHRRLGPTTTPSAPVVIEVPPSLKGLDP